MFCMVCMIGESTGALVYNARGVVYNARSSESVPICEESEKVHMLQTLHTPTISLAKYHVGLDLQAT